MYLILLILCGVALMMCFIFLVRNQFVYRFRSELLKTVSRLASEDIENNRPWTWRYTAMDSVSYDVMMVNFWVPLRAENFYEDLAFIK